MPALASTSKKMSGEGSSGQNDAFKVADVALDAARPDGETARVTFNPKIYRPWKPPWSGRTFTVEDFVPLAVR